MPESNEIQLPDGWRAFGIFTTYYTHDVERLVVAKHGSKRKLYHRERDTGHLFNTPQEAIAHAEDARIHGG